MKDTINIQQLDLLYIHLLAIYGIVYFMLRRAHPEILVEIYFDTDKKEVKIKIRINDKDCFM